jgi:hypothetical protein
MSNPTPTSAPAAETAALVPPPSPSEIDGLSGVAGWEDPAEKRVDEIEMIGEEEAAGLAPRHSEVTAGMRYLHCSRTIHQLVTDRNRAVGIYLAVASLLWTANSALLNARQLDNQIVPLATIQRYCMPATLAILAVLAVFAGFLLIRTRIGLIYEVAKMNVLLGLPVGRVQRVNPLSIFFIMHALISLAGGGAGGLFAYYVLVGSGAMATAGTLALSLLIGFALTLALVILYIGTVLYTTADEKLQGNMRKG